MKITCNNCQELIEGYLCDIPSEWRKQIAFVICKYLNTSEIDCKKVKECETLTSLSSFSINGSEVCITYTDENGSSNQKCFDMNDIKLDLDPKCIMSQEDWDALNWQQQIQALIDYVCTCHGQGTELRFNLTDDSLCCPYLIIYENGTTRFTGCTCRNGCVPAGVDNIVEYLNAIFGSMGYFSKDVSEEVTQIVFILYDTTKNYLGITNGTITFTLQDCD